MLVTEILLRNQFKEVEGTFQPFLLYRSDLERGQGITTHSEALKTMYEFHKSKVEALKFFLQGTESTKPKKEKKRNLKDFTHLLYFKGPVNPMASIIFVKAPTFSSTGCGKSLVVESYLTKRRGPKLVAKKN